MVIKFEPDLTSIEGQTVYVGRTPPNVSRLETAHPITPLAQIGRMLAEIANPIDAKPHYAATDVTVASTLGELGRVTFPSKPRSGNEIT